MPRKRTAEVAELDIPLEPALPPDEQAVLDRLRNMWEFASLMQYIYLFGAVVKIDDELDIEDLEAECVKAEPSQRLAKIGLQLLKYVSSHRGLTLEIFDEYARRQYVAKAPKRNPFGDDEEPRDFNSLDIYTRIRVLHQLSTWTFGNADRIRGLMPEDEDHLMWRMEPLGWDKEDRAYFVLDDNRLYRRSDEPLPPPTPVQKAKPKPKAKAKAKSKSTRSRGTRTSKRRKVEESEDEEEQEEKVDAADIDDTAVDDTLMTNADETQPPAEEEEEPGYGFTSKTWELIAITLDDYQEFMATIFRSRDPNEKQLRARLEQDVLPIIEKRAEAIRQKHLKKLRELENMQKMATAKRSSRLAGKAEKEAQEREEREAEEKRQADLRMAHEEQARQKRIEEGHESRRLTREQRVREREAKRILHEEELAKLENEPDRAASQDADGDAAADAKRISERQRVSQKEQLKKELEKLEEEDGHWTFDCSVCGVHGENLDDGSHSVACDRCNVWQHSLCNGFTPKQAEKEGFSFICKTCKRKEADAKKPKIPPLKLLNRSSGSPESSKSRPATTSGQQGNGLPAHVNQQLDAPRPSPGSFGHITNGPSLSPHGQAQGPPGYRLPPVGNFAPHASPPQQAWQGSQLPPPTRKPTGHAGSSPPVYNGVAPSQHQQQHQYAHQAAVSSSGGHPVYQQQQQHRAPPPPQLPRPQNGYGQQYSPAPPPQLPHPQNGYGQQHPPAPPPGQQQQYFYSTGYQQNHARQQSRQTSRAQNTQSPQAQPPLRPDHGQLLNGFQSPTKAAPKSASSPQAPQQHVQSHASSSYGYAQPGAAAQRQPQQIQRSPQPILPPPHHSPQFTQTPKNLPPLSSNGDHASTPQMREGSAHSQGHANNIAADGMSGPWPEGSKAIPQKHDQSPAPPGSAHGLGERSIFPPVTPLGHTNNIAADGMSGPWPEGSKAIPQKHDQSPALPGSAHGLGERRISLAPSPSQNAPDVTGPASIPVKKMQELSPAAPKE